MSKSRTYNKKLKKKKHEKQIIQILALAEKNCKLNCMFEIIMDKTGKDFNQKSNTKVKWKF